MSLVVALANRSHIVIASDTICMVGEEKGFYINSVDYSKVFSIGGERFAVGIAGHVGGAYPLKKELLNNDPFDRTVENFFSIMAEEYKRGFKEFAFEYIFCGFDHTGPQIVTSCFYRSPYDKSAQNSGLEPSAFGKAAIGVSKHGALYWVYEFHNQDMSLETLKLLACFSVLETIKHDRRTKYPLQMMLVSKAGTQSLSTEEVAAIETVYQTRKTQISNLLNQSY